MLGRHGDVSGPLANSYVAGAAREAGSAAELDAARKDDKYSSIDGRYLFEPIAIETLGVYSTDVHGNGIPNGTGNPMGMGIKH